MVWNYSFANETKTESVEVVEEKTESNEGDSSGGDNANTESAVEDDTNGGKKVKQFEGEDPNKLDYLTGVITAANVSGGQLVIRTNIDQYLESGSCELQILQNNGIIYTDKSEIIASASTSTCYGFDVPVVSIGNGNMQIVINLSSGDKTGTINGEVNI